MYRYKVPDFGGCGITTKTGIFIPYPVSSFFLPLVDDKDKVIVAPSYEKEMVVCYMGLLQQPVLHQLVNYSHSIFSSQREIKNLYTNVLQPHKYCELKKNYVRLQYNGKVFGKCRLRGGSGMKYYTENKKHYDTLSAVFVIVSHLEFTTPLLVPSIFTLTKLASVTELSEFFSLPHLSSLELREQKNQQKQQKVQSQNITWALFVPYFYNCALFSLCLFSLCPCLVGACCYLLDAWAIFTRSSFQIF